MKKTLLLLTLLTGVLYCNAQYSSVSIVEQPEGWNCPAMIHVSVTDLDCQEYQIEKSWDGLFWQGSTTLVGPDETDITYATEGIQDNTTLFTRIHFYGCTFGSATFYSNSVTFNVPCEPPVLSIDVTDIGNGNCQGAILVYLYPTACVAGGTVTLTRPDGTISAVAIDVNQPLYNHAYWDQLSPGTYIVQGTQNGEGIENSECNPVAEQVIVIGGCDDGDACTDDFLVGCECMPPVPVCPPSTNLCLTVECNNGNCTTVPACLPSIDPCFTVECDNGNCTTVPVTPPASCDDNNPCTEDFLVDCACVHNEVTPTCDDGNPCTIDVAVDCECMPPEPVCPPSTDPCFTVECDNGNCTTVPVTPPATCDDGDPCTEDLLVGCECVHNGITPTCDDGDPCTADEAVDCECMPPVPLCPPSTDPCFTIVCNNGNCDQVPACAPSTDPCFTVECDNGNCTTVLTCPPSTDPCFTVECNNGICNNIPITPPVSCDDGDPCTDDYLDGCECQHDEISSSTCSDEDGDGYTPAEGDCNDTCATCFPGNPEICDELDNDCNGYVDDEFALLCEELLSEITVIEEEHAELENLLFVYLEAIVDFQNMYNSVNFQNWQYITYEGFGPVLNAVVAAGNLAQLRISFMPGTGALSGGLTGLSGAGNYCNEQNGAFALDLLSLFSRLEQDKITAKRFQFMRRSATAISSAVSIYNIEADPNEFLVLQEEISDQLRTLDKQIEKVKKEIDKLQPKIDSLQALVLEMLNYSNLNCGTLRLENAELSFGGLAITALYPNPTQNKIHFALSNATGDLQVRLIDLMGRQVYGEVINDLVAEAGISYLGEIDMSSLAPGMYVLLVNDGKHEVSKKVVKE